MTPKQMRAAFNRIQELAKAAKYSQDSRYELRVGKNGKRWMRKEQAVRRGQSSPPGRKAQGAHMGKQSFRAAYIGDVRLTGPEHAGLSDEDLMKEAMAEAKRAGILHTEDAEGNPLFDPKKVQIGEWSE